MSDHVQPLPGPLEVDPTGDVYRLAPPAASWAVGAYPARDVARAMLTAAVEGLDLGAHDQLTLHWLEGGEIGVIATIASLLRRARQAGREETLKGARP